MLGLANPKLKLLISSVVLLIFAKTFYTLNDVGHRDSQSKRSTATSAQDDPQAKSMIKQNRLRVFIEPNECYNETKASQQEIYNNIESIRKKLTACTEERSALSIESGMDNKRKRILVTGGAGFVGSHLVDSLMLGGHRVIVCDNFLTGRQENIQHWLGHANFLLVKHDVIYPLTLEATAGQLDEIYHLASPASPVHYMADPIKTIKTNTLGTMNMLELARQTNARLLLASTSEVYGDPQQHPQSEAYWGHVNPIGPRSCYDESKRLAESLVMAYQRKHSLSVGIARIFNTYGPRMHPNDGRVVSNFVSQALSNVPLTVYGRGNQTRSFQYVSDLVHGLTRLMAARNVSMPVNLGNPNEINITSLAEQVAQSIDGKVLSIIHTSLPQDDPHRRRPDIKRALQLLHWRPQITLATGLKRTVAYFQHELARLNTTTLRVAQI